MISPGDRISPQGYSILSSDSSGEKVTLLVHHTGPEASSAVPQVHMSPNTCGKSSYSPRCLLCIVLIPVFVLPGTDMGLVTSLSLRDLMVCCLWKVTGRNWMTNVGSSYTQDTVRRTYLEPTCRCYLRSVHFFLGGRDGLGSVLQPHLTPPHLAAISTPPPPTSASHIPPLLPTSSYFH